MALGARLCQSEAAEGRQCHAAESWQGADAASTTPTCVSWLLMQHADAGALRADIFLRQTRSVSGNSCRTLGSGACGTCDRTTRTPHGTPHVQGVDWQSSQDGPRTRSTHTRSSSSRSRTRNPSERSLLTKNYRPTTRIGAVCLIVFCKFLEFYFPLKAKSCDIGFRMLFQPRLRFVNQDRKWVQIMYIIIWTSQAFKVVSSVVYKLEFSQHSISHTVLKIIGIVQTTDIRC